MRILKRLTAALSSVLLLQLTLLEGGALCVMHGTAGGVGTGVAGVAMPGMAHSEAPPATLGEPQQASSSPASPTSGCNAGAGSTSCPTSTNPAGCASMVTCAVAAVPPTGEPNALAPTRVAAVLPEPSAVRLNPVFAPELPPPRV